MRFSLKPRWRFVAKAVIQEFKQSRLYKMVAVFTVFWFVLNFLSLFGFDLVFKLTKTAEQKWRALNGHARLAQVVQGVRFKDGLQEEAQRVAA